MLFDRLKGHALDDACDYDVCLTAWNQAASNTRIANSVWEKLNSHLIPSLFYCQVLS